MTPPSPPTPIAGKDATVSALPSRDLRPFAVLRRRLLPPDEREEAHLDVPSVRQASPLRPAHHRRVSYQGTRDYPACWDALGTAPRLSRPLWNNQQSHATFGPLCLLTALKVPDYKEANVVPTGFIRAFAVRVAAV